jgi:hypothetical protein
MSMSRDELARLMINKLLFLKQHTHDRLPEPKITVNVERYKATWQNDSCRLELWIYRDGYSEFIIENMGNPVLELLLYNRNSLEVYSWQEFPLAILEIFYE